MKIIPFHFITAPQNSGYRNCEALLRSHPNIEVVPNTEFADFIFYWSWGDDPKIMNDIEKGFEKPLLADITGDHCWVPAGVKGLFFTTIPSPLATCFEVPYSYRFLTNQIVAPHRLTQKYLASFQGSMTTNPKRRELFKFQSPDIFIKEQDGWVNDAETNNRIITEHQLLMLQSKFTFCPVGIGHSSIRVIEAIFAGSIPILIDDFSQPFGDNLDFALRCTFGGLEATLNHHKEMPHLEYISRLLGMGAFKRKFLLRDAYKGIVNELGYLDWIYEKALNYGRI